MWIIFLNLKKNSENNNVKLSPYQSSPKWMIESFFLDIYFLLAHRIKGLGWSLGDFWKCDTWTTSKLYCMELNLIDEEEKELNKGKDESEDSNEMIDLYEEIYG